MDIEAPSAEINFESDKKVPEHEYIVKSIGDLTYYEPVLKHGNSNTYIKLYIVQSSHNIELYLKSYWVNQKFLKTLFYRFDIDDYSFDIEPIRIITKRLPDDSGRIEIISDEPVEYERHFNRLIKISQSKDRIRMYCKSTNDSYYRFLSRREIRAMGTMIALFHQLGGSIE